MSILVNEGRVVIAESISLRPIHIAWGLGDGAWTDPPAESVGATALQDEVGRRLVTTPQFVVPDALGVIELPGGYKFSISGTPTNYLYCTCQFDYGDASSAVIREFGVFVGTDVDAGLPPGQEYFEGAEVTDPGRLLQVENVVPIYRSPAIRETAQFVIQF